MATLYISEYAIFTHDRWGFQAQVGTEPSIASQVVTVDVTSGQSSAFNEETKLVRVHADTTCSIAIGENPTATSESLRLPANGTEYFRVTPGHKLAVISNS